MEKSKVVDLYLNGLTRDEIAKKTGVSAGGVSGVIMEFKDSADSSSTREAAKKYNTVETVESMRTLAIEIRKAETSVEELMGLSHTRERIKKLIGLDRLEEFIKAGESLNDEAHVEASVRLHALEEQTGMSHDDILSDLQSKEAKVRKLSSEVQHLQSQSKIFHSEREKAQTDLNDEKTRLEAELREQLRQHGLTLQRMEPISNIERGLSDYGIDLKKLEKLRPVLDTIKKAGHDPKKVVKLIEERGTLQDQIHASKKELTDTQALAAKLGAEVKAELERDRDEKKKLRRRIRTLKKRYVNLENVTNTLMILFKMGFTEETITSIYVEVLKYRSMPRFMEAFGRYKHREELEARIKEATILIERYEKLTSMGWSSESFEKAINLAKEVGSPEAVLERLELYKSMRTMRRELNKVNAEVKASEERIAMLSEEEMMRKKRIRELEGRIKPLLDEYEYTAKRLGELKKEIETHDGGIKTALYLSALRAGDQETITSTPIGEIISTLEIIKPWLEWKQSKLENEGKRHLSKIDIDAACAYLIKALHKIRED